jgi:hypothetical protein
MAAALLSSGRVFFIIRRRRIDGANKNRLPPGFVRLDWLLSLWKASRAGCAGVHR